MKAEPNEKWRKKYLEIGEFKESRAWVCKKNGKYGFIDEQGTEIIARKYEKVSSFSQGLAWVKLKGKYGYIDAEGNVAVPIRYDFARDFKEGRAIVGIENSCGFLLGYIDVYGRRITKIDFEEAGDFYEGRAIVRSQGVMGFYGDCGVINLEGEAVIPIIYNNVFNFNNRFVVENSNGKFGLIDSNGVNLSPCIYDDLTKLKTDFALSLIA